MFFFTVQLDLLAFHTHFGAYSARNQRKKLKLQNKPKFNPKNLISSIYEHDKSIVGDGPLGLRGGLGGNLTLAITITQNKAWHNK